jgi:hypothetical protein
MFCGGCTRRPTLLERVFGTQRPTVVLIDTLMDTVAFYEREEAEQRKRPRRASTPLRSSYNLRSRKAVNYNEDAGYESE